MALPCDKGDDPGASLVKRQPWAKRSPAAAGVLAALGGLAARKAEAFPPRPRGVFEARHHGGEGSDTATLTLYTPDSTAEALVVKGDHSQGPLQVTVTVVDTRMAFSVRVGALVYQLVDGKLVLAGQDPI
jgi:hypothetical protein